MYNATSLVCAFFLSILHIQKWVIALQVWGAEGAGVTLRAGIRPLLSRLQPSANLVSACTPHHRMSVRLGFPHYVELVDPTFRDVAGVD